MSRIVISLGGKALGNAPDRQLGLVKQAVMPIVDLTEQGHDVIVSHGNGIRIGCISKAFEVSSEHSRNIPAMPLPECVAMSQGYIGYHFQNCIGEELRKRKIDKKTATIITQVLVDIKNRQKASPKPVRIVEKDIINSLVEAGVIVIALGGGGIPVAEKENALVGVDAVIDKDIAGGFLAEELGADYLFVLTKVDKVSINFNKSGQKDLDKMSVDEAQQWISEGQFHSGSMLPKIEAAVKFVKSKPGRKAIISSVEKAGEAIIGNSGTIIYG